jgi:hypothetical protein
VLARKCELQDVLTGAGVAAAGTLGVIVDQEVSAGTVPDMTSTPDDDMVQRRKILLPDEQAAGSDDPEAQAEAILQESEERTLHPEQTRHESKQTPDGNRPD